MTISDFFCTTSFLFSIVIIIIGCIFIYINHKISEQDHKLTSMVNLVSVLAQDLHFLKNKVNYSHNVEPNVLQYPSQLVGGENNSTLISVSDNEDDEYDEDDDEENNEEEDYEEEDEEEEDEEEEDEEENEDDLDYCAENSQEHIKFLNLSLGNDDIDNNLPMEDLNTNNYSDLVDVKTIYFVNEEENDIEEKNLEENDFEEKNLEEKNLEENDIVITEINSIDDDIHFLKNVVITDDLGDIQDLTSKTDYKKMSTTKLREIVISKGIITDASKLKKHDILKLLGDE